MTHPTPSFGRHMNPAHVIIFCAPFLLGAWHLNLALLQAINTVWNGNALVEWIAILAGPASTLPAVALAFKREKLGGYWLLGGGALSFVAFALREKSTAEGCLQFLVQISLPMIIAGFGFLYFAGKRWRHGSEANTKSESVSSITRRGVASPEGIRRALHFGMVAHALGVLITWIVLIEFDVDIMPARVWLIIAWLWLAWPAALLLHPPRFSPSLLFPLAISIALLSPCVSTIYAFTSWIIWGFAP